MDNKGGQKPEDVNEIIHGREPTIAEIAESLKKQNVPADTESIRKLVREQALKNNLPVAQASRSTEKHIPWRRWLIIGGAAMLVVVVLVILDAIYQDPDRVLADAMNNVMRTTTFSDDFTLEATAGTDKITAKGTFQADTTKKLRSYSMNVSDDIDNLATNYGKVNFISNGGKYHIYLNYQPSGSIAKKLKANNVTVDKNAYIVVDQNLAKNHLAAYKAASKSFFIRFNSSTNDEDSGDDTSEDNNSSDSTSLDTEASGNDGTNTSDASTNNSSIPSGMSMTRSSNLGVIFSATNIHNSTNVSEDEQAKQYFTKVKKFEDTLEDIIKKMNSQKDYRQQVIDAFTAKGQTTIRPDPAQNDIFTRAYDVYFGDSQTIEDDLNNVKGFSTLKNSVEGLWQDDSDLNNFSYDDYTYKAPDITSITSVKFTVNKLTHRVTGLVVEFRDDVDMKLTLKANSNKVDISKPSNLKNPSAKEVQDYITGAHKALIEWSKD